jgi:nucleotide-binding universal stress UspA family protein
MRFTMIIMNAVLVATDFCDTSEAALLYGRNLARAFGAKLHVLHVARDLAASAAAEMAAPALGTLQQEIEDAAKEQLDALLTAEDRHQLSATGAVRVSSAVAQEIVAYAKSAHVDVIVVGTHGRGPVSHLFVGSVAEKVVRLAPCPVLVVRPNEHEFVVPDPVSVEARL